MDPGHARRCRSPRRQREEARKLLLTIDPLATLAQTQEQIHERLLDITPAADRSLRAFWERAAQTVFEPDPPGPNKELKEQFLILVTCRDEKEQVKLLGRFAVEGLECKALVA